MRELAWDAQRDRVGAWAARHDEAALVAGMRAWLGPTTRKPSAAEARAALAFAVIAPPPGEAALFERYRAAMPNLSRAERLVLDAWSRTWLSVLRITAVRVDEGFDVHDVLRDVHVKIHERSATHQLTDEHWLLAAYVDEGGRTVFEGTAITLPTSTRLEIVQAALRELGRLGVSGPHASPEAMRRLGHAMVSAQHQSQRPPRFVNADGHDVLTITATLDIGWDALVDELDTWDDADVEDDYVNLRGATPTLHDGHPVCRAAFHRERSRVTLFVNSRERMDEVRARWESATGTKLPVLREETKPAPSTPGGREIVVDSQFVDTPAGTTTADIEADMRRAWCDKPIPALDGLSPRQAVRDGRRAEVWALLWDPTLAELLGLTAPAVSAGSR